MWDIAEEQLRTVLEDFDETFEEIVGTKGKVDWDETIYDTDEKGRKPLIIAADVYGELGSHMIESSGYHLREAE